MYTTIIFDFDGTLADTFSIIFPVFQKIAKEEKIVELLSDQVEDLRNMSPQQLLKEFNVPLYKLPFLLHRIRSEVNQQKEELQLFPEIKEVLLSLKSKKIRLGIASSNQRNTITAVLKKNDIEVFEFVHTQLNIFGKAQMLKGIINKYQLDSQKVLYVGDEVRDIEACHKISVKCAAVTWGFNSKHILAKYEPTYLIESPSILLNLI